MKNYYSILNVLIIAYQKKLRCEFSYKLFIYFAYFNTLLN